MLAEQTLQPVQVAGPDRMPQGDGAVVVDRQRERPASFGNDRGVLAGSAEPIERHRDSLTGRQLGDKAKAPGPNLDDALVPRLATTPGVAAIADFDPGVHTAHRTPVLQRQDS